MSTLSGHGGLEMGFALPLPKELVEFLKLPVPQSILVRGPPGSGKTTLCLALLEGYAGERYFVSNRVPQEEVLRGFEWLGENGTRAIQVIDNTRESPDALALSRTLLEDQALVRSDDPATARDLAEFLWLPEPVQETWSRLDAAIPSLMVLDSWEALIEGYLGGPAARIREHRPSRDDVERALLRRITKAKTHVVFVLEREEQTHLDYLVNGVVTTHRDVVNDRLERWLTIQKLRGVRIENASYPFSLESARFECILPVRPYGQLRGGRFDPSADPLPNHLWPGSSAFADAFGRLPFGGLTMIELEPEVPARLPYVIVTPMVAQTIEQGGHVLFVPDSSTRPEEIWEALHGAVHKRRFLEQVRFLVPGRRPGERVGELEPTFLRLTPSEWADIGRQLDADRVTQFAREGATPERPGLIVASVQGLIAITSVAEIAGSPEAAQRIPSLILDSARSSAVATVALVRTKSPLLDRLTAGANLRIHMRQRQGRIFLFGTDPWTPGFVLTEGHETTPYGLLRIV
ncbi:MAG TPA: gas vesicle protein GvpD P-loop domain-containing protein [Thermoplasmata archaeon]|nr:gas vesicle protein GvpD P-loop domain-containing protein [Thermoplasmata archaeon]